MALELHREAARAPAIYAPAHGKVACAARFSLLSSGHARPAKVAAKLLKNPCRKCSGEGRVDERKTINIDIPAGVDEGTRIRVAGKGEAGPQGAAAGDLYIFISSGTTQNVSSAMGTEPILPRAK